jgi:ATP-dependent RNA helicase DDX52/ROK1
MDPFKLLSRSSKLSKSKSHRHDTVTPSSGQNTQPQLFAAGKSDHGASQRGSRKRKRGHEGTVVEGDLSAIDFFQKEPRLTQSRNNGHHSMAADELAQDGSPVDEEGEDLDNDTLMSLDDIKRILKRHKLKVTWLNPPIPPKKERRKAEHGKKNASQEKPQLFPRPLQTFESLRTRYNISIRLIANVKDQGFKVPTEVQLLALPLLLEKPYTYLPELNQFDRDGNAGSSIDLLTVAPTGSGKTLAYVLPLLHKIQLQERKIEDGKRHTSAIILVPTKELAGQIVNEGRKLARATGITITQMRKGMALTSVSRESNDEGPMLKSESVVKADIIVSTPGVFQRGVERYEQSGSLSQIHTLVLDEADVLLDPLFREQTLAIWKSLDHQNLRISMWSATMGSNIETLALDTIEARRGHSAMDRLVQPIVRLVVGLKDSAVPNVQHKLVYAATEQGKLMGLRQLLHPAASSVDSGPLLRPPFLVFTQTIERAVALHAELLYDIPAEAGGIERIAVLHSDLSDTARDTVMTRFRKGEVWVLITTDLLSRGVDFRGVNGVVNYDIPNSSAAYVHRVGRTGRAGRNGGVAVTLYSKEDIPFLKHVANVADMAQKGKGDQNGLQQWLLEAIPKLSKNEKQKLKKRGIESRSRNRKESHVKTARKTRISTKAGFVRRTENKRKGAIQGSQRRVELDRLENEDVETDFAGFD